MARTAVRRVANEWDGPSMLKVYAPYIGTPAAPEKELPALQDYVQRIDRYTYGLGWLLCEIDHQTAGFCHLSEDPSHPEDLFSVEIQLYVRRDLLRRGVGSALWSLMRDMMEMGNRRRVLCRVDRENQAALAFSGYGVCPLAGGASPGAGKAVAGVSPAPWAPGGKAHQALFGGSCGL